MPKAIRIHQPGGPEVLRVDDVSLPKPSPGDVRVRQTAVGINYIDVYHRSGQYPLPLPTVLGVEAAGVVEEVGAEVAHLRPGDRVAYVAPVAEGRGSYAEARVLPAWRLVKLPEGISDRTAAGAMLKGLTVRALVRRTYPVKAGDAAVVHAAAGGVGTILVQWLKALGAVVIATVGSDEKARLAQANGADHVIVYTREDFAKRVREITNGEGVPVVYDAVGKATFEGSLDCLRTFGLMVTYGSASGPVPPFDTAILGRKGSLYLTRPTVFSHVAKRADLEAGTADLFEAIQSRKVRIDVGRTFPLAEAAEAHRALEARATTGSVVLVP
jgi:NADPH2:quinone reductase